MSEQKKAFRINVVDVLITLVIIAVLTVGILMIANAFDVNAAGEDETTVEYTVQFKRIRNEFMGNIKIGDTVVDAQKRHNLGTVVGVYEEPYVLELYDVEDATRKAVEYPDFCTIEMTVTAKAYLEDGMWMLKESGKEIGIGTALYIHLPNFCGEGYISEMEFIK